MILVWISFLQKFLLLFFFFSSHERKSRTYSTHDPLAEVSIILINWLSWLLIFFKKKKKSLFREKKTKKNTWTEKQVRQRLYFPIKSGARTNQCHHLLEEGGDEDEEEEDSVVFVCPFSLEQQRGLMKCMWLSVFAQGWWSFSVRHQAHADLVLTSA